MVLMVVSATMAKADLRGGLADRPWSEPRTGAELFAEIIGCPKDRHICVDCRLVCDTGACAKRRNSNEGSVKTATVVAMGGHMR